ncbi:MAG: phage portal protein, partial [Abyssibacter sp.]|uniref:phage portal protein n=1 Tax=Abyssibacter sp. TaxID=2320200 RepID=UPI00321901A3
MAPIADIVEGDTVSSAEALKWPEVWFDGPTPAGVSVTSKSAMRVSAVYGCVRLIAGAIAGLPKTVYERKDIGRQKVEGHPLWWLLNRQPCASFTAATFWEYVVTQVLLRGDAIAYIQR